MTKWILFSSFACTLSTIQGQTPPPHPAWEKDQVHEIRLRFAQPDYWAQLTANYMGTETDAAYLEASLTWGPYRFDSIGVRFKGNSSYRVMGNKKPFRLKLNEFLKGQKIEGIGAFNLSNGAMDPSMVREGPYYEMATAAGLKAPRTNYAALYINDQYWGLYILGEVVNSDFLKNYFGKGEDAGNLYKGNIGATFAYLGTDKAVYKEVWEKQTNEESDDWSDLIALCKTLADTPRAELEATMGSMLDVDSFLSAIALDNATVNLDSYIGMGQNFNIYRRPSDKRWVWIVWDPSLAFGAFSQGVPAGGIVQLPLDWTNTGVGGGGGFPPGGLPPGVPPGVPPGGTAIPPGRPLFTKLLTVPSIRARYLQIYKQMIDKVFVAGPTIARMNSLRAMIRPFYEADTQKLSTMAQFDAAMTAAITTTPVGGGPGGGMGGGGTAPGLQPLIEGRLNWLRSQLEPMALTSGQLQAGTTTLTFSMPVGGTAAAQRVSLTYTGVGTTPTYSILSKTSTGGNWLTPSPTGTALPGAFQVAVSSSGLAPGSYTGTVAVHLSGAVNSPVTIPVTLNITALGTPVVTEIVNAASYARGALAPGTIVTLFGSNLGPTTLSMAASGVQVTFDGVAATLLYVKNDQIGAVAPLALAGKSQTTVKVIYGNQSSAEATRPVAATAPGLFTLNASGTGPGAIINQGGTVNSAAAVATKGSTIAIYLTGAGVVNASQAIGAPVAVMIGGQAATVTYAGAAPGSIAGLYQVNATIPSGTPSGAVPVGLTIGGVAAQSGVTATIQ